MYPQIHYRCFEVTKTLSQTLLEIQLVYDILAYYDHESG